MYRADFGPVVLPATSRFAGIEHNTGKNVSGVSTKIVELFDSC
jgi:hypothetical protein